MSTIESTALSRRPLRSSNFTTLLRLNRIPSIIGSLIVCQIHSPSITVFSGCRLFNQLSLTFPAEIVEFRGFIAPSKNVARSTSDINLIVSPVDSSLVGYGSPIIHQSVSQGVDSWINCIFTLLARILELLRKVIILNKKIARLSDKNPLASQFARCRFLNQLRSHVSRWDRLSLNHCRKRDRALRSISIPLASQIYISRVRYKRPSITGVDSWANCILTLLAKIRKLRKILAPSKRIAPCLWDTDFLAS